MWKIPVIIYFLFFTPTIALRAQVEWGLQKCITVALERNSNLRISKLDIDSKASDIHIARNERLPGISAFSNISSNFGQSQDIFGNNARNDNFNSNIGVSSNLSLFTFGRIKNNVLKAESTMKASQEDMELEKRNTRVEVVQAYLQVLLQKEIGRLMDSNTYFSALQVKKIQKSADAGAAALSVLYEAKASHHRDIQKQAMAEQDLDKSLLSLKQTMYLSDTVNIVVDDDISVIERLSMNYLDSERYLADLWTEHPLTKKYRYLNESLLADGKIIRSTRYPSVDLSVNVGSFYFNNLTSSFGKMAFMQQMRGNFSQQVTLSFSIPIYNKNMVKQNIQKNRYQLEQNVEQLALSKQKFYQQIEKYLVDCRNYERQLALTKDALASTQLAFSISQKSFEAGKISIYDLNNSRANLLTAESEVIQVRYNLIFAKLLVLIMTKGDI